LRVHFRKCAHADRQDSAHDWRLTCDPKQLSCTVVVRQPMVAGSKQEESRYKVWIGSKAALQRWNSGAQCALVSTSIAVPLRTGAATPPAPQIHPTRCTREKHLTTYVAATTKCGIARLPQAPGAEWASLAPSTQRANCSACCGVNSLGGVGQQPLLPSARCQNSATTMSSKAGRATSLQKVAPLPPPSV
jgi:hypothetical protein